MGLTNVAEISAVLRHGKLESMVPLVRPTIMYRDRSQKEDFERTCLQAFRTLTKIHFF